MGTRELLLNFSILFIFQELGPMLRTSKKMHKGKLLSWLKKIPKKDSIRPLMAIMFAANIIYL